MSALALVKYSIRFPMLAAPSNRAREISKAFTLCAGSKVLYKAVFLRIKSDTNETGRKSTGVVLLNQHWLRIDGFSTI